MEQRFFKNLSVWLKSHLREIFLFLIIVLSCLLSFALGYITAKFQEKIPLKFEESTINPLEK